MKQDLSALATNLIDGGRPGDDGGRWRFQDLVVIASWGGGWDHVSASLPTRCPTWSEMEGVREMFFEPEETVIQISPPRDLVVNFHPYCLHLWRPQDAAIPLPPRWMIAPVGGRMIE